MVYPKAQFSPNFIIITAKASLVLNAVCRAGRSWRYLVYLKYWTLNLRPLRVYPELLFHVQSRKELEIFGLP